MKKNNDIEQPEISKFLVKDTQSLRNEKDFTTLGEMVHPLTYTDDLKTNPNMHLIPLMDKHQGKQFKELVLDLLEL